MKNIILVLTLLTLLFSIGCYSDGVEKDTTVNNGGDEPVNATFDKAYSEEALDFANKIFRETFKEDNAVMSPLSLYVALSMASNGALAETQEEFGKLLCGENYDENKLNNYNRAIMENAKKMDSYTIANSLWIKEDKTEKAFRDVLGKVYKADVDKLTTEVPINNWVKEKTKGKIPSILNKVNQDDFAVIVNAIYYYGTWMEPFKEKNTRPRDFHLENGTDVKTDFMWSGDRGFTVFGYKDGLVLRLNCKDKTCMYFYLPPEGMKLKDYAKEIDFKEITNMKPMGGKWEIFVPKFKIESSYDLIPYLENMGLKRCFNLPTSNLSRLSKDPRGVYFSKVIQKATIDVEEKGVEATAATAIVALAGSAAVPPKINYLYLDRPFAYVIYNNSNDTVVFTGTVYDPTK